MVVLGASVVVISAAVVTVPPVVVPVVVTVDKPVGAVVVVVDVGVVDVGVVTGGALVVGSSPAFAVVSMVATVVPLAAVLPLLSPHPDAVSAIRASARRQWTRPVLMRTPEERKCQGGAAPRPDARVLWTLPGDAREGCLGPFASVGDGPSPLRSGTATR